MATRQDDVMNGLQDGLLMIDDLLELDQAVFHVSLTLKSVV